MKKRMKKRIKKKPNLFDWFLKSSVLYTILSAATEEVTAKIFSCIKHWVYMYIS